MEKKSLILKGQRFSALPSRAFFHRIYSDTTQWEKAQV